MIAFEGSLEMKKTLPMGKCSREQAGDRADALQNINFHQFGRSAKSWKEGGLLLPRQLTFLLTSLISTDIASAGEQDREVLKDYFPRV